MTSGSTSFSVEELLEGLGLVGFERRGPGRFAPIGRLDRPFFGHYPGATGDPVDLAELFPFLDSFLDDAEQAWASEDAALVASAPWKQRDDAGRLAEFRALAARFGESAVLLFEVEPPHDSQSRQVLQLAREQRLAQERLERTQRALEESEQRYRALAEELDERVRARTVELRHANEQLRELTNRLVAAEQAERRRIAVGLHDRLGQSLAVVRLGLGSLRQSSSMDETVGQELSDSLDAAIRYTRDLTFDLGSPVLYELGFEPAVEELTRRFADRIGVSASFEGCGVEPPEGTAVLLYEAVRELFHNCEKHAAASEVVVRTGVVGSGGKAREFSVVVEDNGRGFDPQARRPSSDGFGLFSLSERLRHVDGACRIESRPGQGTRVVLVVGPVEESLGSGSEAIESLE